MIEQGRSDAPAKTRVAVQRCRRRNTRTPTSRTFLAGAFLAVVFFLAAGFLAAVFFLAAGFLAGVFFFAGAFLAVAFLAGAFLAAGFLTALRFEPAFLAIDFFGPDAALRCFMPTCGREKGQDVMTWGEEKV